MKIAVVFMFVLLIFLTIAVAHAAQKINIEQAAGYAIQRDECIPIEIKNLYGGYTTVIRLSPFVFKTSNFRASMYFDYDGENIILLTVHSLDSEGHLIIWTRDMGCDAI